VRAPSQPWDNLTVKVVGRPRWMPAGEVRFGNTRQLSVSFVPGVTRNCLVTVAVPAALSCDVPRPVSDPSAFTRYSCA
jgi:hypothetical protein